jgi:hypothetical protein
MQKAKERSDWRELLVTALLRDVYETARSRNGSEELSESRCQDDVKYVLTRCANEGVGFLTETLPRLGKALDCALSINAPSFELDGFEFVEGTKVPRFLYGLFVNVLSSDGCVLQGACPHMVRLIRQVAFVFYKLELPIAEEKSKAVIDAFVKNERDLAEVDSSLALLSEQMRLRGLRYQEDPDSVALVLSARWYLSKVLRGFSLDNVHPCHGPGGVSGKEKPWEKWDWTTIPDRTAEVFPLDTFFFVSMDDLRQRAPLIAGNEPSARVILVPKDSRGPRLISAEPKEFQFLQQGINRHMVDLVESHYLTRRCVFFTDQRPNQLAALCGSLQPLVEAPHLGVDGTRYATLDLKDASDLVSLELVRMLFPPPVVEALEACRSQYTTLPDGQVIRLRKFAPMGSATCFPVLALTVWSLLAAGLGRAMAKPWFRLWKLQSFQEELERIHVYGDDVIVPTAFADTAIHILERFGLRVNRNKSCIRGLFRESCGCDAYKGVMVTPLRIKGDWYILTPQQQYCKFIAYANEFGLAGYSRAGQVLADLLHGSFRGIPGQSDIVNDDAPCLLDEYVRSPRLKRRTDRKLQKFMVRVRVPKARSEKRRQRGYVSLLRFFTEKKARPAVEFDEVLPPTRAGGDLSEYTQRHDSELTWRWCETAPRGAGTIN